MVFGHTLHGMSGVRLLVIGNNFDLEHAVHGAENDTTGQVF